MMSFLQTGKALYVLAAICLAGVFTRLMAGSFYKRLIKESTNMALTKNKYLRGLKQNAEDTYRMNQGMNNTRVYLERQMYSLRTFGMSVKGLDNLSGQLTLLCFLAGGGAAFLSYWFRRMNREGTAEHVPAVTAEEDRREPANLRSIGRDRRSNSNNRRGLEQTAASREKQEEKSKDNWLQDLNPEQKRMLGELLKEFIS